MSANISDIIAYVSPYNYYHDRYQQYYVTGMRLHQAEQGGLFTSIATVKHPKQMASMRRIRYSYRLMKYFGEFSPIFKVFDAAAHLYSGEPHTPSGVYHPLVGQYIFRMNGHSINVCIDSQDSGEIASSELLAWSDIYFKTNFRPDLNYSLKIHPCVNGNPTVLPYMEKLKGYRAEKKEYDICFVVRVWGGKNETDGIEHNLRLVEALSKVNANKYLMAYLVAGDIPEYIKRLDSQGIPWTTQPVPLHTLWEISARSQINVIRLGMHDCIPWRMTDMLAMGACIALDKRPITIWPQPLREDINFLNLDQQGTGLPPDDYAYYNIPDIIENALFSHTIIESISKANASRFDNYYTPLKVGQTICRTVISFNQTKA